MQCSLVQFSCSVVSDSLQPHGLQHARPPCPSPTLGVYSDSCPLSQWCHPTISSSLNPFSSCLNFSQHQGLFQWVSSLHHVAKVLGVSASASVLPMNIQDWFSLGWTSWKSLQLKSVSRVLFRKASIFWHSVFFIVQLSHPYMTTGKTIALTRWTLLAK